MVTSAATLPVLVSRTVSTPATHGRRRISPHSARALETLGHAIEYLSDVLADSDGEISDHAGEVEAIRILMALNSKVYSECPITHSLADRFFSLIGAVRA